MHMPHRERRVTRIVRCEGLDKADRSGAIRGGTGTKRLPRPGPEAVALARHRQAVWMLMREPRRGRGRSCGEIDQDAVAVQEIEHVVQPVELVAFFLALQKRPGEHSDCDKVDSRLAQEVCVL